MKKHFNPYAMLILALAFILVGCSQNANDSSSPLATDIKPDSEIAASVDPVQIDQVPGGADAECEAAGCDADFSYKIDNNTAGNPTVTTPEGNVITISNSDGKTFDWSSTWPVSCVLVKAGEFILVYSYGASNGDQGLWAPENKDISHVTFCYDEPAGYSLTVNKTAYTEFTRTNLWTVDKQGDQTQLTLCEGDAATVNYSVTVNSTEYVDSDWLVKGTITIANIAPEGKTAVDAVVNSISDIAGGVEATVDCALPLTIPAGETVECTYTAVLPAGTDGTNSVTVTTSSQGVTGATATADYAFDLTNPTTVLDNCVTVSDDKYGDLGQVCLDAAPQTFNYALEISYDMFGLYTYTNTASFVTGDTGTEGSDSWDVSVRVCQCETAWGGDSPGEGRAWWFYYDTSVGGEQTIWAGQNYQAGTVSYEGGNIVITLEDGWELTDDSEAVKIQGYNDDDFPTKRPSAGKFDYKGRNLSVYVGDYHLYYAVHLDVRRCPQ